MLIADIEKLEEMGASELHARRLNAKEVLTPKKGDNLIFPSATGTVKISGGDPRLRPSTLIRDRPERGEEQEILRGESGDGLRSQSCGTSTKCSTIGTSTICSRGGSCIPGSRFGSVFTCVSSSGRNNRRSSFLCTSFNFFPHTIQIECIRSRAILSFATRIPEHQSISFQIRFHRVCLITRVSNSTERQILFTGVNIKIILADFDSVCNVRTLLVD